ALYKPRTLAEKLIADERTTQQVDLVLLAQPVWADAGRLLGERAGQEFIDAVAAATQIPVERLLRERVELPWLGVRLP
ncbi:hypothetical protein, partial [Shewanella algae]|uniref:hypothetical protein n=1 Tax=Shewanella algae TaxID=38313 RepID=UPI00313AB19C